MMPVMITPEEADEATVRLGRAIDNMVLGCGLDPAFALGARVKLAVCELYERVPEGFTDYITVAVRHDPACVSLRLNVSTEFGRCNCKRTVEIGCPDAGEPVIVH